MSRSCRHNLAPSINRFVDAAAFQAASRIHRRPSACIQAHKLWIDLFWRRFSNRRFLDRSRCFFDWSRFGNWRFFYWSHFFSSWRSLGDRSLFSHRLSHCFRSSLWSCFFYRRNHRFFYRRSHRFFYWSCGLWSRGLSAWIAMLSNEGLELFVLGVDALNFGVIGLGPRRIVCIAPSRPTSLDHQRSTLFIEHRRKGAKLRVVKQLLKLALGHQHVPQQAERR